MTCSQRAALDAWERGQVSPFLSMYVDDATHFDWNCGRRIDGLPAIRALLEPFEGAFRYDGIGMLEPCIQRYGDVAVLTYSGLDLDADGAERRANRASITEVFARVDGAWRLVHSHCSRAKAETGAPEP